MMAWWNRKSKTPDAPAKKSALNAEEQRLKEKFNAVSPGTYLRTRTFQSQPGIGPQKTQWLEAFLAPEKVWLIKSMTRHDALARDGQPAPVSREDYRQDAMGFFDAVEHMAGYEATQADSGYTLAAEDPGEHYFRTIAENEAVVFDYDGMPHPVNEQGEVVSSGLFPPDAFDKARAKAAVKAQLLAAQRAELDRKRQAEESAANAQAQYRLGGIFTEVAPLMPCDVMADTPGLKDEKRKKSMDDCFAVLQIHRKWLEEEEKRNINNWDLNSDYFAKIDETREKFLLAVQDLFAGESMEKTTEFLRVYKLLEANILMVRAGFYHEFSITYDAASAYSVPAAAKRDGALGYVVGLLRECGVVRNYTNPYYFVGGGGQEKIVSLAQARVLFSWFENVRLLSGMKNQAEPEKTVKALPPAPEGPASP